MKKRIALVLALFSILLLFASCAASNDMAANDSFYNEVSKGEGMNYVDKDYSEEVAEDVEKKIIKTYRLNLESLDFDSASNAIVQEAESLGGYISSSSERGNASTGSRRSASYTVRVPANAVEAYIDLISKNCNVLNSSLSTQDVTDSYYDSKSRLESLEIQEARLMELLDKAGTLNELLAIEDKLTDVRAQINSLNKELQLLDKSVDYSYVYIDITEVIEYKVEKTTYLARLGESFVDSFENFAEFTGNAVIVFVWMLPFLLVGGVVAVIVVLVVKKNKRKTATRNDAKNDEKK